MSSRPDEIPWVQGDLFESDDHRPLTWNDARANVPPGWWARLERLWGDDIEVLRCEENDGHLELEVRSDPADDLSDILQRFRQLLESTCSACGGPVASLYTDVGSRPWTLCVTCAARMRAGADFATVADRFFLWNGDRRPSTPVVHAPKPATNEDLSKYNLAGAALRQLFAHVRSSMMSSVIGQDAAVSAVALAGVVHAATNVKRSPSLLLYGASGQGKTTIAYGLRDALRNAGYDLPFFFANAVDLTGNAWSGAPSINRLVEHAVSRLPIDSLRAQRMMGVIDELDKLKRVDHSGGHGNVLHRVEEQHSALLPLLGGGTISLGEDGRQYDASRALVICAGTFTAYDRARKLSMDDLVKYFPLELASRFEQMIEVQQLSENALIEIMQRWPALSDLMAVARTFGIHVHVEPAVFRRAARLVLHDGNTTPRTAAGYIVSALRTSVVAALNEDLVEIDVAPDSLDVPLGRSRNAEPPDGSSGFSQLWP